MKFDRPCPVSRNDSCVVGAWHWPNAWEIVGRHKAHVVVSASGADAKTRSLILAQLAAAVIEATPDAVAVHWASSDALWPARTVSQLIGPNDDAPPTPLCVSVKLSRDAGKGFWKKSDAVSAITRGLSAFGLPEIETRGFKGDLQPLNMSILDLASYLIDAGPVVKDGDTIGPDETTRVIVRHEESSLVPGQKVYHLYFP